MNGKEKQTHEKLAKAVLIQHLLRKGAIADDVVIVNELALESFSRRADLALVNGSIELFEIKSEADTLSRLQGQVETFSRFCDKLHIIGAPCHIESILSSTPEHVAVWQLEHDKGITVVRRGKKNLLRDKKSLLKLINIKELRQLLATHNIKVASSRRKHLDAAAMHIPTAKLRLVILSLLKARYAETTARFIEAVLENKAVRPKHITELKRPKQSTRSIMPAVKQAVVDDASHTDDLHLRQLASEQDSLFGAPPEDMKLLLQA